jgi:hypothetical protein
MAEASRPHTFSHTWLLFRAVGVLGVSYATALLMFLLVEARLPPSLLRCVSLLRSPGPPSTRFRAMLWVSGRVHTALLVCRGPAQPCLNTTRYRHAAPLSVWLSWCVRCRHRA